MQPYVRPGIFCRYDPVVRAVPIVLDVSRSGRDYPTDFRSGVPFSVLHDNVSMYVDEIWSYGPQLGATLLYACFPNTYIDANRSELDIDAELIEGVWPVPLRPDKSLRGLGLLKAKSRYGEPMQERKLTVAEVMHRLDRYYRPYHAELSSILSRHTSAFGYVYHLSLHCMSATGAPTHPDYGQERPDFCIGNIKGISASPEFTDFLVQTIRGLGFSCTVNDPYSGGELTARYGNPSAGIESVMIEINKNRFMDVRTFLKNDGFSEIQQAASTILQRIAKRPAARLVARNPAVKP